MKKDVRDKATGLHICKSGSDLELDLDTSAQKENSMYRRMRGIKLEAYMYPLIVTRCLSGG